MTDTVRKRKNYKICLECHNAVRDKSNKVVSCLECVVPNLRQGGDCFFTRGTVFIKHKHK